MIIKLHSWVASSANYHEQWVKRRPFVRYPVTCWRQLFNQQTRATLLSLLTFSLPFYLFFTLYLAFFHSRFLFLSLSFVYFPLAVVPSLLCSPYIILTLFFALFIFFFLPFVLSSPPPGHFFPFPFLLPCSSPCIFLSFPFFILYTFFTFLPSFLPSFLPLFLFLSKFQSLFPSFHCFFLFFYLVPVPLSFLPSFTCYLFISSNCI